MNARVAVLACLTCIVTLVNVQAYEPPRQQVRYNQSYLDVPDGYKPYPFRTAIWYRYVDICSNLVVNMNLTNMGQGDEAVVIEITNCYLCHGVAILVVGWGTGAYNYSTPASFSRPVHINISSNVMDSTLVGAVVRFQGVFPERTTIYVANNTFVQSWTKSANSYRQSFLWFEGVWLRRKSQLRIVGNKVTCNLPMQSTDPTSTCVGFYFTEGFRLDDASQVTITENTVTLGAHEMYAVAFGPEVSTALHLSSFSVWTMSKNMVDTTTIPALLAGNSPQQAAVVYVAFDTVELLLSSTMFSLENTFTVGGAAGVNMGWWFSVSSTASSAVTISSGSSFIMSTDTLSIQTSLGANGMDGLVVIDDGVAVTVSSASSVVIESCVMSFSGATPVVAGLLHVGGTIAVTGAGSTASSVWLDNNGVNYGTATNSLMAFVTLRKSASATVSASTASGFVVRENTCSGCGNYFAGSVGTASSATISAMTTRCNVQNLLAATTSTAVTVTSLTTAGCGTCSVGLDCFSASTVSASTVAGQCRCVCTAAAAALPTYGGHCVPGGIAMSLPPYFTSTQTLTWQDSKTPSLTTTWTESLTDNPSSSTSQSPSPTVSPSVWPTYTETPNRTASRTQSPSRTVTRTETPSTSQTSFPSISKSPSVTDVLSRSNTVTDDLSATATPSLTFSLLRTLTTSPSMTPSLTSEPTASTSPSHTTSPTASSTASPTMTRSPSATETPTLTSELSRSFSITSVLTLTMTVTFTKTASKSPTETLTLTRGTRTGTSDRTLTSTMSISDMDSVTDTMGYSNSVTRSPTNTTLVTATITRVKSRTHASLTISPTGTTMYSVTGSATQQFTYTETESFSPTTVRSQSRTTSITRTVSMTISESISNAKSTSPSHSRTQSPSSPSSSSESREVTESRTTTITHNSFTVLHTRSTSLSDNVSLTISGTKSAGTRTTTTSRELASWSATRSPSLVKRSRSHHHSASRSRLTPSATPPPRTMTLTISESSTTTFDATATAFTVTKTFTKTQAPTPTKMRMSRSRTHRRTASRTLNDTVTETLTMTAAVTRSPMSWSHVVTDSQVRSRTKTVEISKITDTWTISSTRGDSISETQTLSVSAEKPSSSVSPSYSLLSETDQRTDEISRSASPSLTESVSLRLVLTATENITISASSAASVTPSASAAVTLTVQTITSQVSSTFSRTVASRSLAWSNSSTKSDSVFSHMRPVPLRTLTQTATVTDSLPKTRVALGGLRTLSLTDSRNVSGTPSMTLSRSVGTRTLSESDNRETVTKTIILTRPPTPSHTKSSTVQPESVGNAFLTHLNPFFISSLSFNSCSWLVVYLVGPLLLALLVHGIGMGLWQWGCFRKFPCCPKSRRVYFTNPDGEPVSDDSDDSNNAHDGVGESDARRSMWRSLIAVSTYGSVIFPCNASCWWLHSIHLCLHVVAALALCLYLSSQLGYSTLFRRSAAPSVENITAPVAFVVFISLLASQITRPLFHVMVSYVTWSDDVMETEWKRLVRSDPDLQKLYLADSDEEPPVGVVVGAPSSPAGDEREQRVFDKVEWDNSVGFSPLYEDELDSSSSASSESSTDKLTGVVALADVLTEGGNDIDAVIRFHMDAPQVDATELFQQFQVEQKLRRQKSARVASVADDAAAMEISVIENEPALKARVPSVGAAAAAVVRIHRRASRAAKAARAIEQRKGKEDMVMEDIDIGELIERHQAGEASLLPPLEARDRTHDALVTEREGITSGGIPSMVDAALAHHLSGGLTEVLLERDDALAQAAAGPIVEVERRRKHHQLRKLKSVESAVVEGLMEQHLKGIDLAAIDSAIGELPDVGDDFLATEVAEGLLTSSGTRAVQRNAKREEEVDRIRTNVKRIINSAKQYSSDSTTAGETGSVAKRLALATEADMLINAHLMGEELDHLESIEERQRRRQQEFEAQNVDKQEVHDLISAFALGQPVAPLPGETQTASKPDDVTADEVLERFLDPEPAPGEPSSANTATAAAAEVDMLLSEHLDPKLSAEAATVNEFLMQQMAADEETLRKRQKEREQKSELADDVAALVDVHMEASRDESRRRNQKSMEANEVDDVLAYFHGASPATPRSIGQSVKRRRKPKKKQKQKQHRDSDVDDEGAMGGETPQDHDIAMVRPVIPLVTLPAVNLSPPTPRIAEKEEVGNLLAEALLQPTSPFRNRRLALETPRSSPSATPRVQRYVDVVSGSDGAGSGSANEAPSGVLFERHSIGSHVELLPDMDAETPQPDADPYHIPKSVDSDSDWVITRTAGEDAAGALDAETLVQEDIEATLRDLDMEKTLDIDLDGSAWMAPVETRPNSATDVATFFLDDTDSPSSEGSQQPMKLTKTIKKKKKKIKGRRRGRSTISSQDGDHGSEGVIRIMSVRRKSTPPPNIPLHPDSGFRTLHAAASPEVIAAAEGHPENGSGPSLTSGRLSLRVLDSARVPTSGTVGSQSVAWLDDIDIPSIVSELSVDSDKIRFKSGGALVTSAPAEHDESESIETNSDVDHLYEKHCTRVDVAASPDDKVYVPLPVTTYHTFTAVILLLLTALALFGLYHVLVHIQNTAMCSDGILWEAIVALFLVDVVVFDPAGMLCVLCIRYLQSDERNFLYRGVHPRDQERRYTLVPPLRRKYRNSQLLNTTEISSINDSTAH